MADGVHPVDGFRRHPGRAQVGPDKLGPLHHPGRVTVDDADVMTGVQKGLDHMRPDEPASPGDQDPHLEPPVVDVILPVLDERAALPGVLASIPAGYRAVVVDNGSTDGSGQVAASLGARGGERTAAGVRGGLLRRPTAPPRPMWCASWTATALSTGRTCPRSPPQSWRAGPIW